MDRSEYEALPPDPNTTPNLDCSRRSGEYHEMSISTYMGSKANDAVDVSRDDISAKEMPMKEKVIRHFENHYQKWKRQKRGQKCCGFWKVIIHIVLVITVTIQASEQCSYSYVRY